MMRKFVLLISVTQLLLSSNLKGQNVPYWRADSLNNHLFADSTNVKIDRDLNVGGFFYLHGSDFLFQGKRAIATGGSNKLTINFGNDFVDGIELAGNKTLIKGSLGIEGTSLNPGSDWSSPAHLVIGDHTNPSNANLRIGFHNQFSWMQAHGAKPLSINPLGNNVGIGTTSPIAKLHVAGNSLVDGYLGIGTDYIPNNYLLAVEGKVICEELKVQLSTNWPDYVFKNDYSLLPLAELEETIKREGHLPGIPSANEIEKDGGFSVGEMQRLMLEKIEELTLYVIDLEKSNAKLRNQLNKIKSHKK